ncbi:benzoate/H(+) symporter BenE family transporter [Rhodomicrobium lacus]|uniref:benzoate/H(+) symporter BenE family transporter n=1 Tax=Rhodomicrobium lacus TaxID=2498452 RepID=UPI000F8D757D|nr:benzoate/H(+) symporter BenE family transporter [Rhodomicrobium lacus]
MWKDFSFSATVAGFIAVVVSYAGPSLIIFQAASAAHLSHAELSSWIWAISIGAGISAIALSLFFRAPVITAWSTPGAALLVTSLPAYSYPEAIGAFVFAAALIMVIGISGLFDAVMARIPKSIASAMLAGILFRFGAEVFTNFPASPVLVGTLFAAYVVLKRLLPRYAIALVLVLGVGLSAIGGELHFDAFHIELARPVWTTPEFSLAAIIGLGVPLALVTLTGQFLTGVAVLRAFGYGTPSGPLVWNTSALSVVMAPFGSHGVNLAAITAAICSGTEANHDAGKRYIAGVALGVIYIIVGLFGATLASLFASLPKELVAAVAGLALLGAIMNGLAGAMDVEREREPAVLTFLVTASGMSFLGIGSAFWGLAVGVTAALVLLPRVTTRTEHSGKVVVTSATR